jgi:hypothetical protein
VPEKKEFDQQKEQGKEEHENRNPVDPVHIANPFALGCIGVFFADIEIFSQLTQDAHESFCLLTKLSN